MGVGDRYLGDLGEVTREEEVDLGELTKEEEVDRPEQDCVSNSWK